MIVEKDLIIPMFQTHWVSEAIDLTPSGDMKQIALIPRDGDEPFPGLTDAIESLIKSDCAGPILGIVANTEKKVMNIRMDLNQSTHTEDRP